MINLINKGSIVSFFYFITIFFLYNNPIIKKFIPIGILIWALDIIKFAWIVRNQKDKIKEYVFFYFSFISILFLISLNFNFKLFLSSLLMSYKNQIWHQIYLFIFFIIYNKNFFVKKQYIIVT